MGQAEQAKEYLSQQLAFFRIYPMRFARVQILFALALYQLKQHEQAFEALQQALETLMPTQAVRVILDEDPLIWDILSGSKSAFKSTEAKAYSCVARIYPATSKAQSS
jgi:LuxR family maltose regulon positive regulatory protein